MVSWLLDTCVVSELVRPRSRTPVVRWVGEHDEDELFPSVITIGELEKGIAELPESPKRVTLEHWVRRELADRFRSRLLAIDSGIAARWGAMVGATKSRGQPPTVIDSPIAATRLQHGLTIDTRNADDLERSGARCFNPRGGR